MIIKKIDLKKPLTKSQKFFCLFAIALIIILLNPELILLTRKASCELLQPKQNDLCWALMGRNTGPGIGSPELEMSGYHLTVRPKGSADFNDTTYNILTGEVINVCGFWVGFAMQTSRCASPEELEKASKIR